MGLIFLHKPIEGNFVYEIILINLLSVSCNKKFWEYILQWLNKKLSSRTYEAGLKAIRIVSREKTGLEAVSTESALAILVRHAGLNAELSDDDDGGVTIQDTAG